MLLKFREEKIRRDEALVQDKLPAESYLLEENKALSEEIELLRTRIENNPEVTRFALENIRLSNQLKMYAQCRSACTHYTFFYVKCTHTFWSSMQACTHYTFFLCEMHTYTFWSSMQACTHIQFCTVVKHFCL
jgi:hypothetical protein